MSARSLLIATLAGGMTAVLACGCGITDPYQTSTSASTTRSSSTTSSSATTVAATSTPADVQDPPAERGGTIPTAARAAQQRLAAAASRSPRRAVLRYAALYVNWTAGTLAGHQRQLARLSIGAARQAAQQQATSVASDHALTTDHVANHGQVISAQPGAGAAHGEWVIVTREQTTGTRSYHGLPYQLHVTYATVTRTRRGWVITQWSPQT
jgi:hypothetical protein